MADAIAASLADMGAPAENSPVEETLYQKLAKEYGDDPEMI